MVVINGQSPILELSFPASLSPYSCPTGSICTSSGIMAVPSAPNIRILPEEHRKSLRGVLYLARPPKAVLLMTCSITPHPLFRRHIRLFGAGLAALLVLLMLSACDQGSPATPPVLATQTA